MEETACGAAPVSPTTDAASRNARSTRRAEDRPPARGARMNVDTGSILAACRGAEERPAALLSRRYFLSLPATERSFTSSDDRQAMGVPEGDVPVFRRSGVQKRSIPNTGTPDLTSARLQ